MTAGKSNGVSLKSFFSEIDTIPVILQDSRFPSLDGLRGVAIIMVVMAHFSFLPGFFYTAVFNGHLGVLIFFVLSGFLITTLCIKEKVTTHDISLKNFYIRRALRILPVAYLYILVIIVLKLVFKLDISYINLLGTALFLMNFTSFFRKYYFSWYTVHYWSLSVEEQFYLIVPFLLKKQFKACLFLLLFIVFVLPPIICLQYLYPTLNQGILYGFTHFLVKFQAIAVGCLFSVIVFKYTGITAVFIQKKVIGNIIAITLIMLMQYDDFFTLRSVFSSVAITLLIGYIMVSNIIPTNDLIFKFLNTRILKLTGVLSYSIYIWQQLLMSSSSTLPHFINTYPFKIIAIIVVSCLSYYFYESYFLRLKTKFKSTKTVTA